MQAKRYDQAAALYAQILSEDPSNLSAWMGLVSAHHELSQDTQAIADVRRCLRPPTRRRWPIPASSPCSAAIYQQANQFEVAQGLLERAAKIQAAAGGQPSVALNCSWPPSICCATTPQAYDIYHQVLAAHPDSADAWKGLIATLPGHQSQHRGACRRSREIPAAVRKQLETDIDFLQTEASLYAATGDIAHAVEYMNRVQAHYATLKTAAAARHRDPECLAAVQHRQRPRPLSGADAPRRRAQT